MRRGRAARRVDAVEGDRRPAEGHRRRVAADPRHRPQDGRRAVETIRQGERHLTRHRGSHFAELDKQRSRRQGGEGSPHRARRGAVDATDWNDTAAAYRGLMAEWKAAGRAPRDVEDQLWTRFRAAQEAFFSRRNQTFSERDAEFEANAAKKERAARRGREDRPQRRVGAARRRRCGRSRSAGRRPGRFHASGSASSTAGCARSRSGSIRRGAALAAHRPGDIGPGGAVPRQGRAVPRSGREGPGRRRRAQAREAEAQAEQWENWLGRRSAVDR